MIEKVITFLDEFNYEEIPKIAKENASKYPKLEIKTEIASRLKEKSVEEKPMGGVTTYYSYSDKGSNCNNKRNSYLLKYLNH